MQKKRIVRNCRTISQGIILDAYDLIIEKVRLGKLNITIMGSTYTIQERVLQTLSSAILAVKLKIPTAADTSKHKMVFRAIFIACVQDYGQMRILVNFYVSLMPLISTRIMCAALIWQAVE